MGYTAELPEWFPYQTMRLEGEPKRKHAGTYDYNDDRNRADHDAGRLYWRPPRHRIYLREVTQGYEDLK